MSTSTRRALLLAIALIAGLLAPFAGVSPASAATSCTVTTTLTATATQGYYGQELPANFAINATCTDGASGTPDAGTLSIQRLRPGSSTWETAATLDLSTSYSFASWPTLDGTAQFKLAYSGGTDGSGYTFPASESAAIGVTTLRDVGISSKKVKSGKPIPVTWSATPAATGFVYLKKKGKKKWKLAKRVAVSTSGTTFKLRAKVGTKVRFYIPGNASIAAFDWTTKVKRR
ncbi:MAG: hypothetical protein QM572_01955 [Nocardioides sp.]|uniref:hypothetical protein n=1 Tax=Nocardioides sp. TaxID=35761 RepID=UPI0039E71FDF